jgi:hypothetical protein
VACQGAMNGKENRRHLPYLTLNTIPPSIATAKMLMSRKISTICFSSRFPLFCAWAMPVVVCRPAGERHIQDAARFKALIGSYAKPMDFRRG